MRALVSQSARHRFVFGAADQQGTIAASIRGISPARMKIAIPRNQANSTVNRVPWPRWPRAIWSSPPICATRDRMSLMPSLLQAAGSIARRTIDVRGGRLRDREIGGALRKV